MKILIHYPFEPAQIQAFQELAERLGGHQVIHVTDEESAVAAAPEVEVILGHFRPAVCAAAPRLRWIQSFSTGMDKFLFPEIIEREEVQISNVAGLYASQGAEHAWALLLALARQIPLAVENRARRLWQSGPVIQISGGTLGLIGLGGFGMEMAKRAQGYDMTILAIDPVRTEKPPFVAELRPSSRENLHDLLRRSDVVMTACPLTRETYHLIGREELALMKPTAYLINVTRGGIIDEPALVEALEKGQIAGAGLDVTEVEPLPPDSPLWDAPNLILTPHRAGASQHRPRMVFEFFLQNLERYLRGERPLNIIDKRRGF
ncbi:D-2-hydroxyacid dehydrogenase [Litorilinea aerophila]|uniref:D-2-hydroxyacid dehydrogenase n=1 Tax=Litorilinea aerophila TaxID=1204385 RepID=A0A540VMW1_9CHLR|nr:D-2-hydroxyacid dehydrogenase [Litorilinea aerophila]MCC9075153.1 D-2-hydroxyacid dehydrogenase [Litorilinea aerophila]GIV78153.1 MAG: phosphoglycerate dehydrogenase [Litorilinea sp.]